MAEIEKVSLDFGIEDTIGGLGDTTLINELTSEASTNPGDISPIIAEVTPNMEKEKGATSPKAKEITLVPDGEKKSEQDILKDYLRNEGDDEEDEEDVVTPTADNPGSDDTLQDNSTKQLAALANDLYKLGIFTVEEGEAPEPIKSPEHFLEKWQDEKKKGAMDTVNTFLNQFGEDYRNAFEAIYVKGVNPKDYSTVYNGVVDFSTLDLTNEDNQVKVMRQALTDQGLDPEDVDSEIDRLKNYGDLADASIKYHKVLVKKDIQKLAKLEEDSQRELQQKAFIKNQYTQNVQAILNEKLKTKEFDGIPLNPKIAGEIQDFLLVDKWRTPTGETLTDFDKTILDLKKPENHNLKVKVALLMKMLEKDPTLNSIQKTGVTKSTNKLFEGVTGLGITKEKASPSGKTTRDPWNL